MDMFKNRFPGLPHIRFLRYDRHVLSKLRQNARVVGSYRDRTLNDD